MTAKIIETGIERLFPMMKGNGLHPRGGWILITLLLVTTSLLSAEAQNPRVALASAEKTRAATPDSLDYEGRIRDSLGNPMNGLSTLAFHFLDPVSKAEIMVEWHPAVEICGGRFHVRLGGGVTGDGAGPGDYRTVGQVFRDYPDLLLQVEADGQLQAPRVRLEPAGHSAKTRYLRSRQDGTALYYQLRNPMGIGAAGKEEDPPAARWKGWESTSPATAIQAATLEPASSGSTEETEQSSDAAGNLPAVQRGAMLLDVIGPGESPALRDLPLAAPKEYKDSEHEINPMKQETLWDEQGNQFGTTGGKITDPLLSLSETASPAPLTPGLDRSWEGIAISGYLPPDTEGAVGPNHYVQTVNVRMQIWNKTGTSLVGPVNTNGLWSTFGGPCQSDNDGDAIVLYDRQADRWVISQFAVTSGQAVCMAVSKTSDPTGAYWLYQINTQRFPDYFKLGTWPDASNNAYFMGTNSGSQSQYDVYAMDRQNMLAGNTARAAQFFQSYPNLMLPADCDGPNAPPAGSPGYFYSFRDGGQSYFGSPPTDSLDIYQFHVDWGTPANSTYSLTQSLTPSSGGFASFNWTNCGFFVNCCLPQPGSTVKLAGGDWWPMKRLVYRNFPGVREALVGSWTVDATGSSRAGIRWFELGKTNQTAGGSWTINNQGTHSPDATNRWMPSIAMDRLGDIALGYTAGSDTVYPSIRYATRLAGDSAGTMQAEATLYAGASSQTSTSCRWGDYSSMTVDPANDCTFWYTSEYIVGGSWRTRIGAFTLPDCLCVTPGTPTMGTVTTAGDNQISVSWTPGAPAGSTYKIYRSNGACPGGTFVLVKSGQASSPWTDISVNGGVTYSYKVSAVDTTGGCESAQSGCASATATGACITAPAFGGLSSVTNPGNATCGLTLAWAAGSSGCSGGSVTYSIYRSTSASFTPAVANLVTSGIAQSTTSYTDSNGLTNGTTYYYVVRAVDSVNGLSDGNTTRLGGAPSGASGSATPISEGAWTGNPPAGWSVTNGGTGTQTWTNTNPGARAVPSGISAPFMIIDGDYDGTGKTQDDSLITPVFNAAGATTVTLAFDTYFNWYSSSDFAYIDVSNDGGSSWQNKATWTSDVGSSSTASHQAIDITTLVAGSSNAKVRFRYVGSYGWYWMVDNVSITVATNSSCSSAASAPSETAPGTSLSVAQTWSDKNTHNWSANSQATYYKIYRGQLADLPNLTSGSANNSCLRATGLTSTTFTLSEAPPAAEDFYWYLVTGVNIAGEGTAGNATSGARALRSSGACP
jgi:hypothetical protein